MTPRTRDQLRFVLKFAILLAIFYAVVTPEPVDRNVIVPFSHALSVVSGGVLNLMGQHVRVAGTVIAGNAFAVDIKNGCNGIEAVVFLCAAIAAFPASWRARLLGILAACTIVEGLNIIRIVSLYLIGKYRPSAFGAFHLAVWQSVIFAAAVFLFVAWTSKVRKADAVASR
ncbi:MAG TPA: exosortase H [Thermoanaerobaculia bacterium]|jgi:exosortase H (IPTLxxWG-CTERM-specific)|nr:exosortase H [Thermoanaerobaculia bacterium]